MTWSVTNHLDLQREGVSMDCQRVRQTMFLVKEEEADPELVELLAPVREHVSYCSGCAQHLDYLVRLFSLVRQRCGRFDAPRSLKVRILASMPHRQQAVADQILE